MKEPIIPIKTVSKSWIDALIKIGILERTKRGIRVVET